MVCGRYLFVPFSCYTGASPYLEGIAMFMFVAIFCAIAYTRYKRIPQQYYYENIYLQHRVLCETVMTIVDLVWCCSGLCHEKEPDQRQFPAIYVHVFSHTCIIGVTVLQISAPKLTSRYIEISLGVMYVCLALAYIAIAATVNDQDFDFYVADIYIYPTMVVCAVSLATSRPYVDGAALALGVTFVAASTMRLHMATLIAYAYHLRFLLFASLISKFNFVHVEDDKVSTMDPPSVGLSARELSQPQL